MQHQKKAIYGQNLYGVLSSNELANYLRSIDVDKFIRSPSAQQAMLDLMDSCHHATAGTGLDAFVVWAGGCENLRQSIPQIRDRWNRIRPDHGLTVHHLARELRLHGNTQLEAKLSAYQPRSINAELRSMIAKVREPMDAHRVIDALAELQGMHPYQVNTVLSKLAKKTNQTVNVLHDLYDVAVQAKQSQGIPWPHYTITKGGVCRLHPTYENFCVLLKMYHIEIQSNLMTGSLDIVWPGRRQSNAIIGDGMDVSEIVSRAAQTDLRITAPLIREYTIRYGQEPGHDYHPVRDWLDAQAWDGLDRFDAFLKQLELANMPSDEAGANLRRWLLQALDALYQPQGARNSALLVLFGPSGCGKTLWLLDLVPEACQADWIATGEAWPMQRNHVTMEWIKFVMRYWLVEFNNLAWLDLEHLGRNRDFLARNVDRVVLHHGQKNEQRRYRRTIFMASVSSDKDITKFPNPDMVIPITIKRYNRDPHLDKAQLWAQLRHEYASQGT